MRKMLIGGFSGLAALALSGCGGGGGGTMVCPFVGPCYMQYRIDFPSHQVAENALASIYASDLSIEFSGSNVGLPSQGFLILSGSSSNQRGFSTIVPWTRTGNTATLTNPLALDALLQSLPDGVDSLVISMNNFEVARVSGTNTVQLSLKHGSETLATIGDTWHQQAGACGGIGQLPC